MLGRRTFTLSCITAGLLSAVLGAQDYFPLTPGGVWIYKGGGTRASEPLVVEVTSTAEFNGVTYSVVRGLANTDLYLREDSDGNVFSYDAAAGVEKPWWSFQSPEGVEYASAVSCCGKAVVTSTSMHYEGGIGTFDNSLEMRYPGVFQVGIDRDVFLPDIGLISRSIATGGPSYGSYELVYARVGTMMLSVPEAGFSLAVGGTLARLTLRVSGDEPVKLTFANAQIYDLVIRNDKGEVVYTWSDGKGFAQVITTQSFGKGEKNWAVRLPDNLPAGTYSAEGYLTTTPSGQYTAKTVFEIK